MLKVPGKNGSLASAKGEGARVELMYSPMEAIEKAQREPGTVFTLAAVGFETTVPAYAMLISEAKDRGIQNIRLITALKTVEPALRGICGSVLDIDGFLCPGHVSVITGEVPYRKLLEDYDRAFVIAGFEGEHILAAIYRIVRQTEQKRAAAASESVPPRYCNVENLYPSAVRPEGNLKAQAAIEKYFETASAAWRGLGKIENSGYYLRPEYASFDILAQESKSLSGYIEPGGECIDEGLPEGCRCADVIMGRIDPPECPMFAKACTPDAPNGPCMVSTEGTCGIWYGHI
jgi:hydrogenase expression/formation protein HypD